MKLLKIKTEKIMKTKAVYPHPSSLSLLKAKTSIILSSNTDNEEEKETNNNKNEKWDLLKIETPRTQKIAQKWIHNFTNQDDLQLNNKYIDFYQHGIDTGLPISNAIVQEVCATIQDIEKINLSNCELIDDIGLWAISSSNNSNNNNKDFQHEHNQHNQHFNLREIYLRGCHQISLIGIRNLVIHCNQIQVLDVSYCTHNLNDECLRVIAANLGSQLRILITENCEKITDSGIAEIANCCYNLEVLNMRGCIRIGEFGDRALLEIGAANYKQINNNNNGGGSAKLKVLDILNCNHVSDTGIKAIAQGCVMLEELHISASTSTQSLITSEGFSKIGKHLIHMVDLTISNCIQLNDKDVLSITKGCPQIVRLDLSHSPKITGKALKAIAQNLKHIYHLYINNCISINNQAIKSLKGCFVPLAVRERQLTEYSGLRSLSIQNCKSIHIYHEEEENNNDSFMNFICRYCSELSFLNMSGCPISSSKTRSAILNEMAPFLLYAKISTSHFGFEPKENEDKLRQEVANLIRKNRLSIEIQRVLRGYLCRTGQVLHQAKFDFMVQYRLPRIQAIFRGMVSRTFYKKTLLTKRNNKAANTIIWVWKYFYIYNCATRKLWNVKIYSRKLRGYAITIQCAYRQYCAKVCFIKKKEEFTLQQMRQQKNHRRMESKARFVQNIMRRHLAKIKIQSLKIERDRKIQKRIQEEKAVLLLQRVYRGRVIGCNLAKKAREKRDLLRLCIKCATKIQSQFRRKKAYQITIVLKLKLQKEKEFRSVCLLQNMWKEYKEKRFAQRELQIRRQRKMELTSSTNIQRVVRGMLSRSRYIRMKTKKELKLKQERNAVMIQRVYRGYKGREEYSILCAIAFAKKQAKPLFDALESTRKILNELQQRKLELENDSIQNLKNEIETLKRELLIMKQSSKNTKYWDSSRITGTPQRFLTSLLRERLEEQLSEMERECEKKGIEIDELIEEEGKMKKKIRSMERKLDETIETERSKHKNKMRVIRK